MKLRRRLEALERMTVGQCGGRHIVLPTELAEGCSCGLVLVAEGRLLRHQPVERPTGLTATV